MARFTLVIVALLAVFDLSLSIPYSCIPISPYGEGIVSLPDGTTVAGTLGGSIYGSGALAAAAADY